ncbi:MAG: MFS transporter [Burkholderia sp.]|nr:MFS transporter [Burkholderia sp.]
MTPAIPAKTTRALRALSFAYFVQATGALSVVGSLNAISREWGLADAQSVYLISFFGVTFAFAAPFLQVGFGHLRRRRQVLIGLSLFSAAALLFAAAPNYSVLVLSRVLMGLGAGFIGPVLGALGSSLVEPRHQGSAIAIVLLGLSIAGLVGMPLSAWVAHVWGARALFVAIACAGAATAALIVAVVPDSSEGEHVELRTVTSLLSRTETLSAFLVVFFIAAGVYSTYSFIAPIVRDTFHAGSSAVSAALVVLGVAGVAGNLFVTRAARRYSAEAMLTAGLALLALDLALPQQRRIVEMVPDRRGTALALTASFVFCGIGFGSAVAGHVYPVFGFAGVICTSLGFLALSSVSLIISRASVARIQVPVAGGSSQS